MRSPEREVPDGAPIAPVVDQSSRKFSIAARISLGASLATKWPQLLIVRGVTSRNGADVGGDGLGAVLPAADGKHRHLQRLTPRPFPILLDCRLEGPVVPGSSGTRHARHRAGAARAGKLRRWPPE